MSYNRKRYRRNKEDKCTDSVTTQFRNLDIQPKILLKNKTEQNTRGPEPITVLTSNIDSTYTFPSSPVSQKGKVSTKVNTTSSQATTNTTPALESSSPVNVNSGVCANASPLPTSIGIGIESGSQTAQPTEHLSQICHMPMVISSIGGIMNSAKKLLMKGNSDFMVVGVLGTQGVGKSTIMNLLANESLDYDYYRMTFLEQESFFPTKLKHNKCRARARTESIQLFITSERLILLDTPPIMANVHRKAMTISEMDDVGQIITLLSACHLVIVVMDDYFNLNFLRLLRFAELMKPSGESKQFNDDYHPRIMFVKNRAKRLDFTKDVRLAYETALRALFKDSQLCIYKPGEMVVGENETKTRKSRLMDPANRPINLFLMPDVQTAEATTFHPSINDLVEEFRSMVFRTPRNSMFTDASDDNEEVWYDWLVKISENLDHFFFKTYEDIQRKHLAALTMDGSIVAKDHDIWK